MRCWIKRSFSLLFIAIFVLTVFTATASAKDSEISVWSEQTTVDAGTRFEVPVQFTGNAGLMGFSIEFYYDSSALTPVAVKKGDQLIGFIEDSISTSAEGSFKVLWCGTEDIILSGTVFSLVFDSNPSSFGNYWIRADYDQGSTFDERWNDVVLNCSGMEVILQNKSDLPKLGVENKSVNAGDLFECPILIWNAVAKQEFNLEIGYDASAMVPICVQDSSAKVQSYSAEQGHISIQCAIESPVPDGSSILLIRFQTILSSQGQYPITINHGNSWLVQSGVVTIEKNSSMPNTMITTNGESSVQGSSLQVPFYIANNSGIMGFHLIVPLGDSVEFDSCVRSDSFRSGILDYKVDSKSNVLHILWSDSRNYVQDSLLFVLNFELLDDTPGTIVFPVSTEKNSAFDENWKEKEVECEQIHIPINKLEVYCDKTELRVSDTLQLSVALLNGTTPLNEVEWISEDEKIVIVSPDGLVFGLHRGSVTIVAQDANGRTGSIKLNILPANAELEIQSKNGELARKVPFWGFYINEKMNLVYQAQRCDEAVRWEWKSSNKKVIVDDSGYITNRGLFARTSIITLTAYNDQGEVVAQNFCRVIFYRFRWQLPILNKHFQNVFGII